jgi:hypothetical protein
VQKPILCVLKSHAYVSKLLSCEWKPHSACKITLCVLESHLCLSKSHCVEKLHSACRNHSRACRNYTREYHIHTNTCQNYTLRIEITLEDVVITSYVSKITLLCVDITLCVYKSHCAGGHCTLRVGITLVRIDHTRACCNC